MSQEEICWNKIMNSTMNTFSVVYGEAASGKTSFVLSLAKRWLDKQTIGYLNTEGEINSVRVLQILGNHARYLYVEVRDIISELFGVMELDNLGVNIMLIDSVNSLYRLEMAIDERMASIAFSLILALLKKLSMNKKTIIATSQVAMEEGVPSGLVFIKRYADNLIRIHKSERDSSRIIYINDIYFGKGLIEDKGFRWISCQA